MRLSSPWQSMKSCFADRPQCRQPFGRRPIQESARVGNLLSNQYRLLIYDYPGSCHSALGPTLPEATRLIAVDQQ